MNIIDKRQSWNQSHQTQGRSGSKIEYIVIHGMAATDANAVPGIWNSRQASAHYGVKNRTVELYVDPSNTAWHAGNWAMNLKSIGVEHLNSTGAPSYQFSDETINTSVEFVAGLMKQYGVDINHVIRHSDQVPTRCPQALGDEPLWSEYKNRLSKAAGSDIVVDGGGNGSVTPSTPAQTDNRIYFDYRGNVREQPTTNSRVMATYDAGARMDYAGYIHGQTIDGSDKWLKTALHGWYVHESVTGGVFGLKDLGTAGNAAPASSGSFTVRVDKAQAAVRSQPNTSAPNAGTGVLYKGNTFISVGTVQGQNVSGNSTWYKSAKGNYVWSSGLTRI